MRRGIACSLLLYLSCAIGLWAQEFQNLDFEQADLSPIPAGQFGPFVPITDAMPGWTGYLSSNQVIYILQNNTTLGAASIDINGPDYPSSLILEGQYTAVLVSGVNPATNNLTDFVNASLAQTGLIPFGAHSILLRAAGTNFAVSFSAQSIPLIAVSNGPNYTVYAGDVFAFAGQVGELRISTVSPLGTSVLFDAITFSPDVIPEPGSLGLVIMGIAGLAFFRRASRKTL